MNARNNTRVIKVKDLQIGGQNKVVIQSMCNIKTSHVEEVIKQINECASIGAEMMRVSVLDEEDAYAIKEIKKGISIPLVADIHFDYRLALIAMDMGVDKVRINPGNIGSIENVKKVVDKAKEKHVPIRIGVNSGSLDKSIHDYSSSYNAEVLVKSAQKHVEILESLDFHDIVISLKGSNPLETIEAYRLASKTFPYPLHLGITEAGTKDISLIRSTAGLAPLLLEGIGDTIRVSLSEAPEREIPVARKLIDYAAVSAQVRASAKIENNTLWLSYNDSSLEDFQLHAAMDAGALLIDGKASDLKLTNPNMTAAQIKSTEEAILQGARIRFSKPEYISCPGCGRTLYNLEETIARIKAATGHLKGVKIAIMGCIVNGPGEMADADFGYVGAGRGRVSLYRGKECIEKNIPEENAVDRLLQLIENTL